jgi:transposase
MNLYANAKLGLAGRRQLVVMIESGVSLRAAAAAFGVSPATAHRWWHRSLASGSLADRSSRPHRQPRRLTAAEEEPILRARRQTSLGPGRLAGIVRRARSTVWKVLHRHGLSRRPARERQSYRRYEWSRPGALLHMDAKKLGRFRVPGHRATGSGAEKERNRGVGYDYLHCVLDDHSRLAYGRAASARGRRNQRPHTRARPPLLRRARPRPARSGDDRRMKVKWTPIAAGGILSFGCG